MLTRRDFFKRLGLGMAAIGLSPLLDLVPIEPARSLSAIDPDAFVAYVMWEFRMLCDTPRFCGIITNISINE